MMSLVINTQTTILTSTSQKSIRHRRTRTSLVFLLTAQILATSAFSPKSLAGELETKGSTKISQPATGFQLNSIKTLADGITFQQVVIDPRAIASVIRIDTKCGAWSIRPYMAEAIETTSSAAQRVNALIAVNSAFFNLSDGESASYIYIDGKQVCDPTHNMALVNNKGLEPFLTKIFNRSELRFLKSKSGLIKMTIQPHSDAIPEDMKLLHSIQAGPQLLPTFTGRQEAFIRKPPGAAKEVDSIGTSMRAARTAFGITDDGTAIIVCVQGKRNKEFSEGISLPALADFMKSIGCTQAINFDGGTSTTMVLASNQSFKTRGRSSSDTRLGNDSSEYTTIVSSQPERQIKSIIYVTPRK
jgi:exopolysaccharide biosynthesis protein